ncbi:hypothetical protein ACQJBY_017674 [Aegilops geniculata]
MATTPLSSASSGTSECKLNVFMEWGVIVICAMGSEWKGLSFLFSRGCKFYRYKPDLQRQQQIQMWFAIACMVGIACVRRPIACISCCMVLMTGSC